MKRRLSCTATAILLFAFFLCGCSVKQPGVTLGSDDELLVEKSRPELKEKILRLKQALVSLSASVDETEAEALSRAAVLYPKYLAEEYGLVSPPNLHNFLINTGFKDRGLCHHWARDLSAYLKRQDFKTLKIYRAIASEGSLREHHALLVTAKEQPFSKGIVLDAWRNSSDLYFSRLDEDDSYLWRKAE